MAGAGNKNRDRKFDSVFFWETARCFLDHELPMIRKKSLNTVASYRVSLNICLSYLEAVKGIQRKRVCFYDLDKKSMNVFSEL